MEKKSNKKLNIMIIILIIIAISIVTYEFYHNNRTTSSTLSNSNSKPKSVSTSSTVKQETAEEKAAREQREKEAREQAERQKQEDEQNYKNACKTYTYKELARNPNNYTGKKVKFTGQVIQIQEDFLNSIMLRVNVTKDKYDFWDDTIYVEYTYSSSNESKILEDDIITLYGDFEGEKTYTTVLGSSVTIPSVSAKYITINE
ncbi:MAG: hypothetical protein HFJ41_02345 [Clostridia bacterium]|jgi:uncharacterized membrane protein YcgQ (UPF0703/DUF1980 family)|nr:hypothetical protein [Clostridia bacterium]